MQKVVVNQPLTGESPSLIYKGQVVTDFLETNQLNIVKRPCNILFYFIQILYTNSLYSQIEIGRAHV